MGCVCCKDDDPNQLKAPLLDDAAAVPTYTGSLAPTTAPPAAATALSGAAAPIGATLAGVAVPTGAALAAVTSSKGASPASLQDLSPTLAPVPVPVPAPTQFTKPKLHLSLTLPAEECRVEITPTNQGNRSARGDRSSRGDRSARGPICFRCVVSI